MRGRFCTQPFLVEGGACRPITFLLLLRWVSRSPPHPTRLRRATYGLWWLCLDLTEQSPGLFDPQGEGFGGENFPVGYPIPFRPTDSPGRAHPAGPGGSPQKDPKGPTNLSAPPTRPAGHASQSFPARRRGKKMRSCFDRLRRPKHTSHPESAGFAGAVRGASPNFGRGLLPSRRFDSPVRCPPERSATLGCPSQNSHPSRSSIW